jgi:hypothetical protein
LSYFRIVERAPAHINSDVAPFDPAKLLETTSKNSQIVLKFGVALKVRHEHAYASHSLLCSCRL